MGEDAPILPLLLTGLIVFYFGSEVKRQRSKLRKVFNVFDKNESVVADALVHLVNSGQLQPYGMIVKPR